MTFGTRVRPKNCIVFEFQFQLLIWFKLKKIPIKYTTFAYIADVQIGSHFDHWTDNLLI